MNKLKSYLILLAVFLFTSAEAYSQKSLYSDVKAHRPGDVITVILSENINGSSASDLRSQSNTNGSTSSAVSGSMLPMDAVFGADATLNFNSDERGLSNQRQLLRGNLSVRIESLDENGNYLIAGTRRTEISGEIYSMSLEGFVRAEDINDANEVFSYRIANADITYENEGGIAKSFKKRGFTRRVIWGVVGLVTGAFTVLSMD
ncbi:flagellar basal body L-ring protein FlgH [Rhodohalobacter mucosus]|nr:flagellar basal body L-ring protein FlgH [Rhodohalobacter mucosus]